MAIKKTEEVKELLSKLDLPVPEGEELPDDYFDKEFKPKYIAKKLIKEDKELVSSLVGNVLGSVQQKVRKLLSLENETLPAEIKDVEGLVDFGVKKLAGEMEELKTKASQGNDKKVNDLLEEKKQYETKLQEHQTIIKGLKEENEKIATEKNTFIKQTNIKTALNDVRSKVKISDEAKKDELRMRGFDAMVAERVAFDWDDKEGLVLKDPITGDRMLKTGGYLSAQEFLEQQAKEAGILQMTEGKGGPAKTAQTVTTTQTQQTANNNGRRPVAPRLGALGA